MKKNRKLTLPSILFSWILPLGLMVFIYLTSSQASNESAALSMTVMDTGAVFLDNWQGTAAAIFIVLAAVFFVGVGRRATSRKAKVGTLIGFLAFCVISFFILYFVIRPYYLNSSIQDFNYLYIHRFFRKYAHLFIYMFLGILLKNAMTYSGIYGIHGIVIAFLICFIFAVSDEIHQLYVPGRTALVMDVVIDSIGAFIGITIYTIIDALCGKRTIWQTYWNV